MSHGRASVGDVPGNAGTALQSGTVGNGKIDADDATATSERRCLVPRCIRPDGDGLRLFDRAATASAGGGRHDLSRLVSERYTRTIRNMFNQANIRGASTRNATMVQLPSSHMLRARLAASSQFWESA